MSLPPSTIRIKRKLDEAPVKALYVDRSETKRQKVEKDFVFRLARTVTSPTDPTPQPFQPQHFPRPSASGIPQVRSTLTPTSRSRPASPNVGAIRTPLTSRTPSPGHGIGPLPPGSKLALDTSVVGSAKRAKSRVPLSAIARGDSYGSATHFESPEALTPVTAGGEKEVLIIAHQRPSDDSEGPVRQGTFGSDKEHSLLSSPSRNGTKTVPSPSTTASKRKAAAAVRRYHLAKRLRIKHPHPYSSSITRRSAIFVQESSSPLTEDALIELDVEMEKVVEQEEPVKIWKRPQTHPEEKKRIEEEKQKQKLGEEREGKENGQEKTKSKVKFEEQSELDPLNVALQNMVFEYLNSEKNDGILNLPTTTVSPGGTPKRKMQNTIGGGLGGGTWKGVDKKEVGVDDAGFVYDVYIREEVKPKNSRKESEDYGLIVINGSDDEEWWYEGDDDADSDDVYGSDDEDSNAEDYHTNDYPEEPTYDSEDADEVDAFGILGNDSADDGDNDSDTGLFKSWNKPRKGADEEEYDLEYDEDEDVEAEDTGGKMVGIWGYREGGGDSSRREVDSGDEMEG